MKKNQYYSYQSGDLPKGCQYCIRGEKLVLFSTGICPRKCSFCPVSDEKFQKNVSFANERRIYHLTDLIKEAKLMNAKGAGITGGDPLSKLEQTIRFIKTLKHFFGKDFHLHLYTSLNLVSKQNLEKLFQAGLDEIRLHLDLDSEKLWERLKLVRKFSWDIGIEIPLIPGKKKELLKLVDYIQNKVDFLNLNELEISDNKHNQLLEMGFKVKSKLSYAVKDSLKLGLNILDYIQQKKYHLKVHLCTAKLKDVVQLSNRIIREAQGVKKKFDQVTDEGLLIRGVLYLTELQPGFNYQQQLKRINKSRYLTKLKPLFQQIKTKMKLTDHEIYLDQKKLRILLSSLLVKKNKTFFLKMGLIPAIVTEYPTADQLEIEIDFLKK